MHSGAQGTRDRKHIQKHKQAQGGGVDVRGPSEGGRLVCPHRRLARLGQGS